MRAHKARATLLVCAGAALAATTAAAPAAPAPPASAARGHTAIVVDCAGHPQTRPGGFVLACGDGNYALTSLHWSQWQPGSADGAGNAVVNNCVPYCAAGRFHTYQVTVRLDNPKPWPGHPKQWHYTRLSVSPAGNTPPRTPAVVTLQLWN
jgi:hypothetical protein